MSVYTCPRCHAPIEAGQPFCKQCGLALDSASLAAFQAQTRPMPVATPPTVVPKRRRRRLLLPGIVGLLALCAVLSLAGRRTAEPSPMTPTAAQVVAAATLVPPTAVAAVQPTARLSTREDRGHVDPGPALPSHCL